MQTRNIIIGVILVGFLSLIYVWFFVYNKSHQNILNMKPVFEGTAQELLDLSDENFIDMAVLIYGEVSETGERTSVLDQAVQIRFSDDVETNLEIGDVIFVRCRLVGYEEDLLLGDRIVLCDQCIFEK